MSSRHLLASFCVVLCATGCSDGTRAPVAIEADAVGSRIETGLGAGEGENTVMSEWTDEIGFEITGLALGLAGQRSLVEFRAPDGERYELMSHVATDSVNFRLRSITRSVPAFDLVAAQNTERTRVCFGVEGEPAAELIEDRSSGAQRFLAPTGELVLDPSDDLLRRHVRPNANATMLGFVLTAGSDAFVASLGERVGRSLTPGVAKFNITKILCGAAAISRVVRLYGPTAAGVHALLAVGCGFAVVLEGLGMDPEFGCPDDFDCDGDPNDIDPPGTDPPDDDPGGRAPIASVVVGALEGGR